MVVRGGAVRGRDVAGHACGSTDAAASGTLGVIPSANAGPFTRHARSSS